MKTSKNWKDTFIVCLLLLLIISYVAYFINRALNRKYYTQQDNFQISDDLPDVGFRETRIQNKLEELTNILGDANRLEFSNNYFESAIWQIDYNLFDSDKDFGAFGGLDYIKLSGHISKKYHPLPAIVYLIVGKYMNIPDKLVGPLKHASETINIEQLFIPKEYAEKYYNDGTKEYALVTGSCASVTISAITVKFCEDMIERYRNMNPLPSNINNICREEYDRRVLRYLCNKGIEEPISWFNPEYFNESAFYDSGNEACNDLEPFVVNKEGFSHCEAISNKDGCNNEKDCNWSETIPEGEPGADGECMPAAS